MARHHDDTEDYSEARDAAFQLIFDRLVAEGIDADAAERQADDEAKYAADGQVQAARDNADECLIGRHEFA